MPAPAHHVRLPDRYDVVRHIANGGMAAVWLAEDARLGRPVAVKVLAPAFAADEVAARRFEREARAAARLSDHPHVVTIYDFGRHEGTAYIVMEHLAGGSVAQRLRDASPVPRETALRWLREAARALDAAHAAGVVHRDVKPGNLLLDAEDRLAVADFGIAQVAAESALTQTGMIVGTAAYLSPEQRAGRAATPASDRYALAMVARELMPDAPPEAFARGLEEDPERRPATAGELVQEIERRLEPTAATVPARGTAPAPPARGAAAAIPVRKRSTVARIAAPVALAVVAAVVALAVLLGGDDSPSRSAGDGPRPQTSERPAATAPAEDEPAQDEQPTTGTTTSRTPPSENPRSLNDRGFAMLPGDPQGAIPLLRRAVEGFRAQGATDDVNYAYALFNLGNALRLAGDPAAAIPFLEERLRISDFKRGVVRKELEAARAEAGED